MLFFILFQFTGNTFAATEIFTVKHRLAADILPVVQAALSPQGKAVADNIGNTIIVNDTAEVLQTVSTLLLSSDQQIPQVRVQMNFGGAGKSGRHLSTGKNRESAFVTVSSGSNAYIRMAREVSLTDQWLVLCRRYNVPIFLKETRTLETGMDVTPVAAGDQVIITVTPRISWVENGRTDSFRFVDAATTITVPRSQWVDLGGMSSSIGNNSDVLGRILSTGDLDRKNNFLIKIKADVQ
jgi:hypothetical protein